MKSTLLLIPILFSSFIAFAQTKVSFVAKTGDAEFDLTLSDMNTTASGNFSAFKQEMKVTYNVTDQKIEYLKLTIKMEPADIFMTLELSKLTGKTIDEVVKIYQTNKTKGWGVIAKELGIKPGSKEFHTLKGTAKGKKDKLKGNSESNGKAKPANTGKGNETKGKVKGK